MKYFGNRPTYLYNDFNSTFVRGRKNQHFGSGGLELKECHGGRLVSCISLSLSLLLLLYEAKRIA